MRERSRSAGQKMSVRVQHSRRRRAWGRLTEGVSNQVCSGKQSNPSSVGFAQASEEVLDSMQCYLSTLESILPSSYSPWSSSSSHPGYSSEYRESLPTETAPGPSCFRANHLKEAVFCPSPDRLNLALRNLVGVVNLPCAGRAPSCILPYLCGTSILCGTL